MLTLHYLATTASGRTFVVSLMAADPSNPIDESASSLVLLAAIKGAFALAAG